MLMYFIIFTIVGFIISAIVKEQEKSFMIFIVIAVLWSFVYSIVWGLVSFAEMALGFFILNMLKKA